MITRLSPGFNRPERKHRRDPGLQLRRRHLANANDSDRCRSCWCGPAGVLDPYPRRREGGQAHACLGEGHREGSIPLGHASGRDLSPALPTGAERKKARTIPASTAYSGTARRSESTGSARTATGRRRRGEASSGWEFLLKNCSWRRSIWSRQIQPWRQGWTSKCGLVAKVGRQARAAAKTHPSRWALASRSPLIYTELMYIKPACQRAPRPRQRNSTAPVFLFAAHLLARIPTWSPQIAIATRNSSARYSRRRRRQTIQPAY